MRRGKLPIDTRDLNPRLANWAERELETAARPVRQHDVAFPAVANTEVRVRHRLPFKAEGFRVIDRNQAGQVYTSRQPDKFYMYLKSDTASLTVTLEVF